MPAEGQSLYADLIAAVQKVAGHAARRAVPAEVVAQAVAHALTAKKPKTRYLIGLDARIQALLARRVPEHVRDRLIARS